MRPQGYGTRNVGFALALGIFVFPVIFVWALLGKGYSQQAKVLGFGWLALILLSIISAMRTVPQPTMDQSLPSQTTATKAESQAQVEKEADAQAQQQLDSDMRQTAERWKWCREHPGHSWLCSDVPDPPQAVIVVVPRSDDDNDDDQ